MLALHQPVAIDLRRIAAAMMITTDLERMGDLAEEIAERALHLAHASHLPIPDKLQRMTDLTTVMVRQSLDAFVNLNKEQAERGPSHGRRGGPLQRRDHPGTDCTSMQTSPAMIEPGLSMFSATRHLERIADHATNIAEDVIYLVEGEIVRHRPAPSG